MSHFTCHIQWCKLKLKRTQLHKQFSSWKKFQHAAGNNTFTAKRTAKCWLDSMQWEWFALKQRRICKTHYRILLWMHCFEHHVGNSVDRYHSLMRDHFQTRLPFNWKAPFGYFAALIIQMISSILTLHCVTTIEVFLFGSCLLFINFAKDVSNDLLQLNADKKSSERNGGMKKRFIDVIQNYGDIKQLSA